MQTKVTAFLDREGVAYRLLSHSEPAFTVGAAAQQRGVAVEKMVKSILLRESKGERYVMACVTGEARLDPKAVRAILGPSWRRLSFASGEEITAVTGYIQGAVNPLCLPDDVPVIFDTLIADCPQVNISSGDPMAGLELNPQDLIRLAQARLAPICKR
jgi:Ala-tRNA(Pro) deacylase